MSPRPIHNLDGSLNGYWDDEAHCWVPSVAFENTFVELPIEEEPPAADEDDAGEPTENFVVDWNSMTKEQLKEYLDSNDIPYPKNANKDTLITLIQANT